MNVQKKKKKKKKKKLMLTAEHVISYLTILLPILKALHHQFFFLVTHKRETINL